MTEASAGAANLGRRLHDLRRRHNVTQERIAEQMRCSLSYISKVEKGKLKPTLPLIKSYAASCGVEISAIIGEEEIATLSNPRSCRNCGESGHYSPTCRNQKRVVSDTPKVRLERGPWCSDCGQAPWRFAAMDRIPRCEKCFAAYLMGQKSKFAKVARRSEEDKVTRLEEIRQRFPAQAEKEMETAATGR